MAVIPFKNWAEVVEFVRHREYIYLKQKTGAPFFLMAKLNEKRGWIDLKPHYRGMVLNFRIKPAHIHSLFRPA